MTPILVDQDVGPIRDFIEHANSLVMENHGRNIEALRLAALARTEVHLLAPDAVDRLA